MTIILNDIEPNTTGYRLYEVIQTAMSTAGMDMSLKRFAAMAPGISYSNLRLHINNITIPTKALLNRYARVLGVEPKAFEAYIRTGVGKYDWNDLNFTPKLPKGSVQADTAERRGGPWPDPGTGDPTAHPAQSASTAFAAPAIDNPASFDPATPTDPFAPVEPEPVMDAAHSPALDQYQYQNTLSPDKFAEENMQQDKITSSSNLNDNYVIKMMKYFEQLSPEEQQEIQELSEVLNVTIAEAMAEQYSVD